MGSSFAIVLIVVVVGASIVAVLVSLSSGGIYDRIGKGGFSLDTPDRGQGPPPGSAAARAEADAEIRQMIQAKSSRRIARGEPALDIEAEIAALTAAPAPADDALREEVRQFVVARNRRRSARGEQPLDVEAETTRQLRDLGN
ncbi:MAG: hypothetical protein NVS2B6_05140 [Thermoleophilaceae bacterium]